MILWSILSWLTSYINILWLSMSLRFSELAIKRTAGWSRDCLLSRLIKTRRQNTVKQCKIFFYYVSMCVSTIAKKTINVKYMLPVNIMPTQHKIVHTCKKWIFEQKSWFLSFNPLCAKSLMHIYRHTTPNYLTRLRYCK